MSANLFTSEVKFMERSRVALTNAESHAEIKSRLEEYNFGSNNIAQGWKIYNTAETKRAAKTKEDIETSLAGNSYRQTYDELQSLFKVHRDKVLIYFKKNPEILVRLGVKGRFPTRYLDFFNKSKHFYQTIVDSPDIQESVSILKITPEVVTKCLSMHTQLLAERVNYDKELGE